MNAIDSLEYHSFQSAIESPPLWKRLWRWLSFARRKEPVNETEPESTDYSICDPETRLEEYKQLLEQAQSIYVFRNGTAVYSMESLSAPEAIQLMKQHGVVKRGTPSADFYIAPVQTPNSGFVVKYSHPQIVSFADSEEYPPDCPIAMAGSMIRLSREMDSRDVRIVAQDQRAE